MTDVAIIGAGPYGLSIASHLRELKIDSRIFGSPMQTWTTQMPRGMRLKSEGFASSLYDLESNCTLRSYCRERNLPYADIGYPVPLETFVSYGQHFQQTLVPHLERQNVTSLTRAASGFELRLDNQDNVIARKVIVAAGITHFQYLPAALAPLTGELVTHSSSHSTFDKFAGKEVLVLGGGASALDVTAALVTAGAKVQLVARRPLIRFHNPPGKLPRPWSERVQAPMTGLGPGWRSWFCTRAPLVFHRMPKRFRVEVARRHLGPAPGWYVRPLVEGKVPFHLGCTILQAKAENERIQLVVQNGSGPKTLVGDHLIAATGYRPDLGRLPFLGPELESQISTLSRTPVLSTNFESSVSGLYFVGAAAANSFGPLLRFAYGAGFTASRLSRHLQRAGSRRRAGSRE